jgi:hypothetical protein
MEQKLKKNMLNNIKIFNELCMESNFIPYYCTNDILEDFIKICGRKSGNSVSSEIKKIFVNENIYNFKM